MTTQPTALRLADELCDVHTTHVARNAAAELRRLHAEVEALRAQRDALLGAMKLIQHATAPTHNDDAYHEAAHDISSAAIDAARERT
jgi:hypothetical protein